MNQQLFQQILIKAERCIGKCSKQVSPKGDWAQLRNELLLVQLSARPGKEGAKIYEVGSATPDVKTPRQKEVAREYPDIAAERPTFDLVWQGGLEEVPQALDSLKNRTTAHVTTKAFHQAPKGWENESATRKFLRALVEDKQPIGWVITWVNTEFIDAKEIGTIGPSSCPYSQKEIEDGGAAFRMLDDDGVKYYTGYFIGDTSSEAAFAPLDGFGSPNAGCTTIQYKGKTGAWETL
jgi:hypothetical protein